MIFVAEAADIEGVCTGGIWDRWVLETSCCENTCEWPTVANWCYTNVSIFNLIKTSFSYKNVSKVAK